MPSRRWVVPKAEAARSRIPMVPSSPTSSAVTAESMKLASNLPEKPSTVDAVAVAVWAITMTSDTAQKTEVRRLNERRSAVTRRKQARVAIEGVDRL
jgi:hypothetical protein